MTLNIAYITGRKEPHMEWFMDSLHRECEGNYSGLRIIVVDFFADERHAASPKVDCDFVYSAPKPTVWQGPYRLTSRDYFAAANMRNTALCHAKDGHIAYVDDLSVLMPGWLNAVREAINGGYVCCGSYRKVKELTVKDGVVEHYIPFDSGKDHRSGLYPSDRAYPCYGSQLFGCSVLIPISGLLTINGWPEDCDSTGTGGEDSLTGDMLVKHGYRMKYDQRMLTLESEEGHGESNFYRLNKHHGPPPWPDPDRSDKGWSVIERMRKLKSFPNKFTPYTDIGALRNHILAGGKFPITGEPSRDWYDNQPLTEL